MIHCFLTGVEVPLEKALVLNRREARELLNALTDRIASLRRVIDQFAPLDVEVDRGWADGQTDQINTARKRHRLVCRTVAEAFAPGFPEIKLFLDWPEYKLRARSAYRPKAVPLATKPDDPRMPPAAPP